jgi:mRNA interferase RelE/StbE
MRNRIKEVIQSPLFGRQKKKLPKDQIRHLDKIVRTIVRNPEAGTMKSGDLQGVHIYKFRMGGIQILLAYEVSEYTLYLYTFGSHENFYRKLKKYRNR